MLSRLGRGSLLVYHSLQDGRYLLNIGILHLVHENLVFPGGIAFQLLDHAGDLVHHRRLGGYDHGIRAHVGRRTGVVVG